MDAQAEIGFTSLGPVLNVQVGFSADRKDALISKITLNLSHQNGERRILTWRGHSEQVEFLDNTSAVQSRMQRAMPPVGLKIPITSLVERTVRFQDDQFTRSYRQCASACDDTFAHLKLTSQTPWTEFSKHKDNQSLAALYGDMFWWRPGKYDADFQIESLNGAQLVKHITEFELTSTDIDNLRANIQTARNNSQNILRAGEEGFQPHEIIWNWRYPSLTRSKP